MTHISTHISDILPPRQGATVKHEKRPLTLKQYRDVYLSSRDLSPDYAEKLRQQIGVFVRWYGSDPLIADLECDAVNEFITAMMTTNRSAVTVDCYRRSIRCIWQFAYDEGDTDNLPSRLKKVRVRREQGVEAFTHAEIAKLVEAAGQFQGYFELNGIPRKVFWPTAIHAAYSTGLRRGDLLRVRYADISDDGSALVVMHKTGYSVAVQFSPEALEGIRRMQAIVEGNDRALPWPFHPNALGRQFCEVVRLAKVRPGQFRWLRRSCGSYAEAANPGSGHRALGHRTLSVFKCHYEDPKIAITKPVSPPPIAPPAIARDDDQRKEAV